MQLNIEKNNFYKMTNVFSVKSQMSKINELVIDNSFIKGSIDVSLYYYDLDGKENFELISLPFELDLESLDVKEVKLLKTNVFVVEGNGLNIEYELEIEYEFYNDDVSEIEIIKDEDIEVEDDNRPVDEIKDIVEEIEEDYEQIKEDTKEFYEEILEKNLRDNVEIISTKSNMDSESFLAFFDDNISYYRLKCLYVENESELNEISTKYNIKMDELLAGYDNVTKKVIFKIE